MSKAKAQQRAKPMARASEVSLFHREIQTYLSSAAVDILLGQAQVLSEGDVHSDLYCGSTMVTIDCSKATTWVSDPCDSTTVRQLASLLLQDERFCERARDLSRREAVRLAGQKLGPMKVELSLRTSGTLLHLDLDVEATPSKARAS